MHLFKHHDHLYEFTKFLRFKFAFRIRGVIFCDDVLCKLTFTFTSMKYMNENCCWITLGGSWGVPACPVPKSDRDRASTDLQ